MKHTPCCLCGAVYVVGGCGGVVCECAFALECGAHDLLRVQLEGDDKRGRLCKLLLPSERGIFLCVFAAFQGQQTHPATHTHYTALLIGQVDQNGLLHVQNERV